MKNITYPDAHALIVGAKTTILASTIDLTLIADYERHRDARIINEKILAVCRTLNDLQNCAFRAPQLNFDDIEKSNIQGCIMHVNRKGIIQLTDNFFALTSFTEGTRLAGPGINADDEEDDGLYFVEADDGRRIGARSWNLENVLKKFHIPYPNRTIWSPINYQGRRGLRLRFENNA